MTPLKINFCSYFTFNFKKYWLFLPYCSCFPYASSLFFSALFLSCSDLSHQSLFVIDQKLPAPVISFIHLTSDNLIILLTNNHQVLAHSVQGHSSCDIYVSALTSENHFEFHVHFCEEQKF